MFICFNRNFTKKNKRKDTFGLLPVVRHLSNESNHSNNKPKKDHSLCDILSSNNNNTIIVLTSRK